MEQKILMRKQKKLFHFPSTVVCQWFVQLFCALQYLHDRAFIHRDVKTANLFLTAEGYVTLNANNICLIVRP